MYARMTTGGTKVGWMDKFIKIYEESVIPDAKSQKGYCGAYFMVDRKTGKVVSITLWDCEEDALANEKSHYYQEQLVKVMNLITKPLIQSLSFKADSYSLSGKQKTMDDRQRILTLSYCKVRIRRNKV
jgi:heme-degrading monooxygenase HmoA